MIDENFLVPIEGESTQTVETWRIENDQEADWAIGKIIEAEKELDRWTRYYNAMIEKVKSSAERTIDFMTSKLREYFQAVPHKDTKTQEKYSLPSGDLVLKKPKEVYIYDADELLAWLKENDLTDEFVEFMEKPRWGAFKKRLTTDKNGIICDAETGLVCNAVKTDVEDSKFVVSIKL